MNFVLINHAKAKEFFLASFFIFSIYFASQAQISFSSAPQFLEDTKSTISMMTSDVNNDQQDDIIVLENGNKLVVHLNNALERTWKKISGPVVGYCWAGIIADFDNDGNKEIVTGSQQNPFRIYTYDYKAENFTLFYQFDKTFFIQNMNVVDINNDGWLDLFLCNDDGKNFTLINDGAGNLIEEEIIDFTTNPVSDLSGNYGSVFLDFDFDGDQDLYIAKCRGQVESYEDPRRINQFYINDGNQNFTNLAEDFGIAVGAQSWVADFADLDLDGDNDLIIANHFDDLQLFENINNDTFVERQIESGIDLLNSFWQLSFMDLDNDGYQDVILTADDLYIYLNNGDFTFSELDLVGTNEIIRDFSVTIGDYNNDGFYDLCTGYGGLTSTSLNHVDSVWLNSGNSNNWIDLVLRGNGTNRDAIGATVYCYQEDRTQLYQIKGGHSYGIMNSTKVHFGLGQGEVDSIKIVWPGGGTEIVSNLDPNQTHFIEENTCQGIVQVEEFETYAHCIGSPMDLNFPSSNFQKWNNGEMTNMISYSEDGLIYAEYLIDGCEMEAWKIYPDYLDTNQVTENVSLSDGIYLACPGEEIEIVVPSDNVTWSNGNVGNTYISTAEEQFSVSFMDVCYLHEIQFDRVDLSSSFELSEELIKYEDNEDVTVNVMNDLAKWYNTLDEEIPFYQGAEYVFENVIEDRVVFIEDIITDTYKSFTGLKEVAANASQPGINVSPVINFKVEQEIILKSIDVYTNVVGLREIEIYAADFTLIHEQEFSLEDGKNTLELDLVLFPGTYVIKTDEIKNQESIGSNGPQLLRESQTSSYYPISDELGTITILGNSFDINTAYYAFYNWRIDAEEKDCGNGTRHKLTLESVNQVFNQSALQITYNNPVRSELVINLEGKYSVEILDINANRLQQFDHENSTILNTSNYSAGYYLLKIENQLFSFVVVD